MRKKAPYKLLLKSKQALNLFLLPLFVLINLLTLLGSVPAFIFKTVCRLLVKVAPRQKRSRGRPRTRPFLIYLHYRLKPLSRIFPKPVRIGMAIGLALAVIFFYSFALIDIGHQLPSPTKLSEVNGALTTTFYDRNGQVLYRLFEDKNRYLVKLEDIPPYLQDATIAIEDKNFYSHQGVDWEGIVRAALAYIQKKELQGGSTITQQLVKNTLLSPERTIRRKIKEVILSFWAERVFSKKEILQMYFNEVPYGGTAWGVAAASQTIFGKQPKDLDLAESAYLAGLPASPTTYSPYGPNPDLGKQRQKEVLRRMVEDGYINKSQAQAAYQEQLNIRPQIAEIKAPHFVMYVKELLAKKYGEKFVAQGGLSIYTSLDLKLQSRAEQIVTEEVSKLQSLNVSNGAAMITDAQNGQILAMVGSKDYWNPNGGSFNVATAPRQPGSSIKPITYATAFKLGYSPGNVLLDTPVVFRNGWEVYAPVNYDGKFHGPVTIRTALGSSFNIPAVKMLALTGIPNMLQTAHDMGITTLNDTNRYGLSLTLGGGEVKLIDMMTVYGTLAQLGIRHDPQPILKVVTPSNEVLEDNTCSEGKRVLPSGVAYLVTNILSDNKAREMAFGPNSLLKIDNHTVAVKTGTTDNKRDNWAFGYTPEYVVGVWVGNNDNTPMDPRLTSGVTGAAPIWNRIMTSLVADKPDLAFVKPPGVVEGIVDGHRDLVLSGQTGKTLIGIKTPKPKEVITYTDPFSTYTVTEDNQQANTAN